MLSRLPFMIVGCLTSASFSQSLLEANKGNAEEIKSLETRSEIKYLDAYTDFAVTFQPNMQKAFKEVNKAYELTETKILDFRNGRMLYDSRDDRDLSYCINLYGITEMEALRLNRSLGYVWSGRNSKVWFPAIQNHLRRRGSCQGPLLDSPFDNARELLLLGIVGDAVFQDGNARIVDNTLVLGAIKYTFDPGFANHLTSITREKEDSSTETLYKLSDYQKIDNVWIPFRQEVNDGKNRYVRVIMEVKLNKVPETHLHAPIDYFRDGPVTTRPYGWD